MTALCKHTMHYWMIASGPMWSLFGRRPASLDGGTLYFAARKKEDDMIASIERRGGRWKHRFAVLRRPVATLTAFTLALIVLVLLIVRMLGSELTMMALSLMFFLSALLVATIAWLVRSRRNSRNLSLWDVAGAFVIIGISASVLADPEHAVELFEHLFERRSVLH
jgi:hypothetical protein